MSGRKEWPELVGQTFEQASNAILGFDNSKIDLFMSQNCNFLFRNRFTSV